MKFLRMTMNLKENKYGKLREGWKKGPRKWIIAQPGLTSSVHLDRKIAFFHARVELLRDTNKTVRSKWI